MFLEYLVILGNKLHSLKKYMSVIRHFSAFYDLPATHLHHKKIELFLKSVSINAPYQPKIKHVFSILNVRDISRCCDQLVNGVTYRALFLVAFYGFLRLSNLVPDKQNSFDITR